MPALLLFAFLAVPLVELAVIVQVQRGVGLGWTILALVAISIAGAVLVKREGIKAWSRFRQALAEGRMPAAEVVDGALLLLAGALLLTPGFVTDGVGLLMLLPPTRAVVNRGLRGRVRRSIGIPGPAGAGPRRTSGPRRTAGPRRTGEADGTIDVEVVEVRRHRSGEDARGEVTPGGSVPEGDDDAPPA